MKASKRNLERLTQTSKYTWEMNGMKYERMPACRQCGKPYFRILASYDKFCSARCKGFYKRPKPEKEVKYSERIRLNIIKRMNQEK